MPTPTQPSPSAMTGEAKPSSVAGKYSVKVKVVDTNKKPPPLSYGIIGGLVLIIVALGIVLIKSKKNK